MAHKVEKQAKTVQEAIELALAELNVDISEVDVKILEEGGKGFLGLGNKTAKVSVCLKSAAGESEEDDAEDESQEAAQDGNEEEHVGEYADEIAIQFLLDVFAKMGIQVSFNVEVYDEEILINISGQDVGVVIGRRGETLDALQYLTNLAVNRKCEEFKRIVLDVENYREKRVDTLTKLANKMASQVVKTQQEVTLEAMNPYERRIIHSSLQGNNSVQTASTGEEPNRCVVIRLK
ncbi:MAG: RNA-binding cell elongation regulator Jag/EloR [Clostridia bacterium]